MVKTLHFQCRGHGSIPGWGTKMPHAMWRRQNIKTNKPKKKNIYIDIIAHSFSVRHFRCLECSTKQDRHHAF